MTTVALTLANILQLLHSRAYNGVYFDSPSVQQLTDPIDHGEGPTWDSRKNSLYYVNIHSGEIYSYHYRTGALSKIQFDGDVTPVVPTKQDPHLFIVGVNRSVVALNWNGRSPRGRYRILATVSKQYPTSRFNDGKADREGRLWFGTMGFETNAGIRMYEGVLYRISRDNVTSPVPIIYPVSVSNGMAWNRANDKFYYVDTPTKKIMEYQYDLYKGLLFAYPRVAYDVATSAKITGFPDGMTIDEEDNLWVALYNGGAVIKVNPVTGTLLQVVPIPAQAVTSVTWGGPNYDVLFVTTSRYRLTAQQRLLQPAAGSVFAVSKLGVKGVPDAYADVLDSLDAEIVSENNVGNLTLESVSNYRGNLFYN